MKITRSALSLLLLLSTPVLALERDALTIWISGQGLQGPGRNRQDFTTATGMPVTVDTLTTAVQFDRLATTSRGRTSSSSPTIASVLDQQRAARTGGTQRASLARAPAFAWEAVTIGARYYGYPLATEAVSLIYNTDTVPVPPRSGGSGDTGSPPACRGQARDRMGLPQPLFLWPIIAGSGGYSLRKNNGIYDLTDIGLNTPGAIEGMESIKRLLDDGLLDPAATYQSMMEGFRTGARPRSSMGPGHGTSPRAGIRFAVGDIPTADPARQGKPFVGVLAAAINSNSEQGRSPSLHRGLPDQRRRLARINAEKPLGAVANGLDGTPAARSADRPHLCFGTGGRNHAGHSGNEASLGTDHARMEPMLSGRKPIADTLDYIAERLAKSSQMQSWRRRHYPLSPIWPSSDNRSHSADERSQAHRLGFSPADAGPGGQTGFWASGPKRTASGGRFNPTSPASSSTTLSNRAGEALSPDDDAQRHGAQRTDTDPYRIGGTHRQNLHGAGEEEEAGGHGQQGEHARQRAGETFGSFEANGPAHFEQAGDDQHDRAECMTMTPATAGPSPHDSTRRRVVPRRMRP